MATKTAVIILNENKIFIWAIPPLSPHPPDFFNHHPTHIPPLFIIPIPGDIENQLTPEFLRWNTLSSWYFGSSQPLYCDLLGLLNSGGDSTLHRFQLMIEPDLSTASLHLTNTPEISPHEFTDVYFEEYMICEASLVSHFMYSNRNYDSDSSHSSLQDQPRKFGVYTGLTTDACFANGIISSDGPAVNMPLPDIASGGAYRLFPCPASGRFLRVPLVVDSGDRDSIDVLDFF